ncbi:MULTISPECIES: DUF4199 domain-containing protein [Muribaculum]|uniref:DUF4199 domain-containing protein n=3 Tax=Muribaculum TaxID=1918540 RepID=A0AC61S5J1_9BACT|nr:MULTISPECIES: DUF4199 domain-containing protein [Muribaculum]THG48325.1 DUF4199 domain-containing protein [Muribaculum caecicola]
METTRSTIYMMYKRSAERGTVFGLYLTSIFLSMAFGITNQAFSVLLFALMCGVPFLIYYWLRNTYKQQNGLSDFSALWMEGIAIFFFGGLLSSFFAFVYIQAVNPHFIETMMQASVDAYHQNPWQGGEVMVEGIETAIKKHIIPSAINVVVDGMWLIVFSGSMLSMLMALLVKMRPIKNGNKMF